MRDRRLMLPLLVLALVCACGDPSSPDDPPDDAPDVQLPPPTGPVTAVITPAGGTLSATTDDGAIVTVNIPPGAVHVATEITVRPVEADGAAWFGVLLEPAGLRLLAPFILEVVLPAHLDVTDPVLTLGPADAAVPLATSFDAATRTLRTNALALFGLTPPAPQTAGASIGLASRGPQTAGASIGAAASGDANRIGAAPLSCTQLEASAQSAFDGFVVQQDFEGAMASALSTAALLQKADCDPTSFLDRTRDVACERAQTAFDNLRSRPTTGYGDFTEQTHAILSWARLLQLLAAECAPASEWPQAMDREIADFLDFFRTRLDDLAVDDYPTFLDLKAEAVALIELWGTAALLGLPGAGDMIVHEAYQPTMARMREVGYALCREQGWHYPLSRITKTGFFAGRDILGVDAPRPGVPPSEVETGFTDADIFADLQYCGTDLDVTSIVVSGDTLATQAAGTEGTPGSHVAEVTLETPTRGSVFLAGDLRALTCWNEIDADTALEVRVNGNRARSLARADDGFIGKQGLLLDIAELADSAGITPQEGVSHELVLTRKRTDCDDGLWGAPDHDVLTVTLDWVNPTLTVDVAFAETIAPGSSEEAVVRVAVVDQSGEPAYFADIDVELTVTGATASRLTGTTDSTGYFRSTITVDDDATLPVTIHAVASSFEGVTAEATHTADIAGGSVVLVESRYVAYGIAFVGWISELDEDVQADTVFAPSASVTASVSAMHDSAGSSGATTSFSGSVTLDADGHIASVSGSGESSAWLLGTKGYPRASGVGNAVFEFDVVGAAATVHVTGEIFASPRRFEAPEEGERGTARVWLNRIDPESGATLEEIVRIDTNTSLDDSAVDTTVVLPPGRYRFTAASNATGDTCTQCDVDAEARVSFGLTVQ